MWPWSMRAGVRSSVAIPLRIGERIIGTFNVASDQLNAYSPEQLESARNKWPRK